MPSFGEGVDYGRRTRHKLETRWSRGVFVGVRVKNDRVQCHGRDDQRLLQSVRGTPWEPNLGDVSTDLPEPLLIIAQLPDVEPTPVETCHSDTRGTRNVYNRKTDLERFGYTAGCPACKVHRAGLPMSGQGHTAECRKRLVDAVTTDTSTA